MLYDHGEPGTRVTTCLPTLPKFPHDGFMEMVEDAWQIKPGKPTISTSSQDHDRWHHELHHPRLEVYELRIDVLNKHVSSSMRRCKSFKLARTSTFMRHVVTGYLKMFMLSDSLV